jgi:pimeloyl-ACP methyl ester carboxylesterase
MEREISLNGKNIHYQIKGKGTSLVLLHGYLESLEMWNTHQEILSAKYQVITIDLPGHGGTSNFKKIHEMDFMAEIVHEVLINEKIQECVMIGHSMGGYTTMAFAEKYPEMLKGFGLFHSHASADTEEAKLNRERSIRLIEQDKGHFIFHFIPSLFAPENEEKFAKQIQRQLEIANQMTKENVVAAMAGMKGRNSSLDILMETKVPVLFIAGKKDSRIPVEKILAQAVLPSTTQLVLLENAGHMSWIEEQQKTISSIDGFMQLCNLE